MVDIVDLTRTAGAIRATSAQTEVTFLRVGRTLEMAIGVLSTLTASFETVLGELKAETLDASMQMLAQVAIQVADLGRSDASEGSKFSDLLRVADGIARRIARLGSSVKNVDLLVLNAKIAASAISTSEIDFCMFADEMARTAKITRLTLDHFDADLQMLRKHLVAAHASHLSFEERQDQATRTIPARLNATVNSVHAQHKCAAQAVSAVWQKSEEIRQKIGSAVLALQTGDIVRQRLEHADYALGLVTGTQEPATPSSQADPTSDDAVVAVTCRLQSTQLSEAAEQFQQDVRRIAASLNGLAADTRTLRDLSGAAYGASGQNDGTFIVELEAQVGAALAMFADFTACHAKAETAMTAISGAAENLCSYLKRVQSLEADIRIMGLNTTLKCRRIGPAGRAIGLIAQELRGCGNEFAKEAGALLAEVEHLAELTRSIQAHGTDSALLIVRVMKAMKDGLATLRQVGQSLGDTLACVGNDSDRVVALLEETATMLAGHDEIGRMLHQVINNLRQHAPLGDLPLNALTAHAEHILELMARSYTMANERVIHDHVLGRARTLEAVAGMEPKPQLEDMLF